MEHIGQMIPIEEAIRANDKVIGICFLALVVFTFVAWIFTIRRERRMGRRIKKAVAKAVASTRAQVYDECHEKALENFINWMEALRELRKTQKERDELKRKYEILYKSAEGCPGVTAARIEK